MDNYKKNLEILKKNHVYSEEMEHDACGVGLIASTEGKKSRKVVEYGIEALTAVWHRGAVDADGKTWFFFSISRFFLYFSIKLLLAVLSAYFLYAF